MLWHLVVLSISIMDIFERIKRFMPVVKVLCFEKSGRSDKAVTFEKFYDFHES